LSTLRFAGLLHDVGKLGVPTRVLTKKGSLTPEEFDEIRAHPLQGFDIITGIDFLDDARTAILHHHERLDGAGYPAGLAGKAIPEFARMIGVVDAFDSMTSSRSYHRARSVSEALAELQRCAGSHFDPAFVDAFCTTVARRGWRMTAGVSGISVNVGVAADDMSDSDAVGATGDRPQPYDHDDPTVAPPVVLDGSR
jgi:HD-GYP domain-containing protein (c-di-GMP phosphodiesterase class II)